MVFELSVVNLILIVSTILVLIYVLLNMKNELTAFKGIYNKEQDYKHEKLKNTFDQLSTNNQQLKLKADEHNNKLEVNETKLVEHDTTISTHTNLLKNSETQNITDIVQNNDDVAENDVYSLIGHNNKLINDKYSMVLTMIEKNEDNSTVIKSGEEGDDRAKIKIDADGSIKFNVADRSNLKVCDIEGQNCQDLMQSVTTSSQ
jgi:hypothetical protein